MRRYTVSTRDAKVRSQRQHTSQLSAAALPHVSEQRVDAGVFLSADTATAAADFVNAAVAAERQRMRIAHPQMTGVLLHPTASSMREAAMNESIARLLLHSRHPAMIDDGWTETVACAN